MTGYWLLLAGVLQPLAMEAYRWAPLAATDDPQLARQLVRLASLAGPPVLLGLLAVPTRPDESDNYTSFRLIACFAALGMLFIPLLGDGIEHALLYNAPYRWTLVAQQTLLVASWWCAIHSEGRGPRLDHFARLAGRLWAGVGLVFLCFIPQIVIGWDTMGGVVEPYDPYTETASAAGAVGLAWASATAVCGSFATVAFFWTLQRLNVGRRFQAWALRRKQLRKVIRHGTEALWRVLIATVESTPAGCQAVLWRVGRLEWRSRAE